MEIRTALGVIATRSPPLGAGYRLLQGHAVPGAGTSIAFHLLPTATGVASQHGAEEGIGVMIFALLQVAAGATGPSFDCGRARTEIEQAVCANAELAALDREEARLYRLALAGPPAQRRRAAARQREFLQARDECSRMAPTVDDCIRTQYLGDIAELRRLYAPGRGADGLSLAPVRYRCDEGFSDAYVTRFRLTPAQAYVTLVRVNEGQPLVASPASEGRLVGRYDTGQILEPDGSLLRINARICTPAR